MTDAVGRTDRLMISVISMDDAENLYSALAGPEVARYIGGPDIVDLDDARRRIARVLRGPDDANEEWLNFTVRDLDGVVIGRLEATVHTDWAEVAWVLGAPWWGRGFGTEGATWLRDHLAAEHHVEEIWATVHPDNAASIAIMRHLRMVEEREPYARELSSWDPGDLVFARRGT